MNTDLWSAAVNQLVNNVTFANMKVQLDKMTCFPTTGENTLIDAQKAVLYAAAALPPGQRPSWYNPVSPLLGAGFNGPTLTGTDGPYDESPWTLTSAVTVEGQADPLGGLAASKITLSAASAAHKTARSFTGTSMSAFLKAGTAAYVAITFNGFTDYATFKLSDGTVAAHNGTVTYAITPVTGQAGWYVCTFGAGAGTTATIGFGDTAAHAITTWTAAGTETFFMFQVMGA